ncbi:MAG: hypothetical protein AB7V24_07790, partial [Steroidobacteraceae bacterium]
RGRGVGQIGRRESGTGEQRRKARTGGIQAVNSARAAFESPIRRGKLAAHDSAILKLLAEIRRLTQFPESTRRGIGFTARWPEQD